MLPSHGCLKCPDAHPNRSNAALVRILDALKMHVLCIPGTHKQDSAFVITLHSPNLTSFSFFALRVSSDSASRASVQAGVGIALSLQTEGAPLDEILVNGRSCAFLLKGSVPVSENRLKRRYLSIVSVNLINHCRSPEAKGRFY